MLARLVEFSLAHRLLAALVREYIATGEPVPSQTLAREAAEAGKVAEDAKQAAKLAAKDAASVTGALRKLEKLKAGAEAELKRADKALAVGNAWLKKHPEDPQGMMTVGAAYGLSSRLTGAYTIEEIAKHGHVLTPGRYVGAEEVADDGEPFEEKMPRLVAELYAQFAESAKLEKAIKANLARAAITCQIKP